MRFRARLATVACVSIVLTALVSVAPANAATPGDSTTVAALLGELRVESPSTVAYNRDLFFENQKHPDGCYTRAEVLIQESTVPVTRTGTCTITAGQWDSYYDGATYTDPTKLEMDHLVALKEVWVSGGYAWTNAQREAYANDTDFAPTLDMVTAAVNTAKSDKDPAAWLPPLASANCRYVSDWVTVKSRWNLSVDPAEKTAIQNVLNGCGTLTVTAPPLPASGQPVAGGTISGFPDGVTRLSGADRYATAIATSQRYAPGVAAVFVATGTNYPDALSAASAAALLGGPLLLTPGDSLPAAVRTEVARLTPAKIYVVGGPNAVSDNVLTALSTVAPTTRLGGADRTATGLNIVNSIFANSKQAIIATGWGFADALAASGAAGAVHAPVILVNGGDITVPQEALNTLARLGVTTIGVAGGPTAVQEGIVNQLRSRGYTVTRYGGADRYATSALINQAYFPSGATTTFMATGANFPDALSGAALAGRLGAPLFSTTAECTPQPVHDAIIATGATQHVVMGGENAVSNTAANNAMCAPGPVVSGTVSAGAFCASSVAGWYGYTSTGILMHCTTSATDSRLRWRQA